MAAHADYAKLGSEETDAREFCTALAIDEIPPMEALAAKMAIRSSWRACRESGRKDEEQEHPSAAKNPTCDCDIDAEVGTRQNTRLDLREELRDRRLYKLPYNRPLARGLTVLDTTDAPPGQCHVARVTSQAPREPYVNYSKNTRRYRSHRSGPRD